MLKDIQSALLIYNLSCGRRRHTRFAEIEEAARILNAAGIRTELAPTTGRGSATGIARHAVAQNRELVIACGGDGTVNEVINGLAGSNVPMALLPAGTANILAKELGIPWNIPAAAKMIPTSHMRRIALGSVHNASAQGVIDESQAPRYFLCVAGAGPDGAMVQAVDPGLKDRAGIMAFWAEGVRQIIKYSFPENVHQPPTIKSKRHANRSRPHRKLRRPIQNHARSQPLRRQFRNRRLHHNKPLPLPAGPAVTVGGPTPQNERHLRLENSRGNLPPGKRRNSLRPSRRRTSRHVASTFPIVPDALTLVVPAALSA